MKIFTTLILVFIFMTNIITNAQLTVKDQDTTPHTLLKVNDEGTSGSITLPSVGMSLSGPRFYNNGGNLYWGTNQLGLAGRAGGWTDDGSVIRLSNATDKVGIGTSSPDAALHVTGIDGVIFGGVYGGGSPKNYVIGPKMIWYPRKAAFRAGYTAFSEWNDVNIGDNSIAAGEGTKASGTTSTAFGSYCVASGITSTAFGSSTEASGVFSTAFGNGSIASGYNSTAFGNTTAASYLSTVVGFNNVGGGIPDGWVDTDPLFEIGNGVLVPSNAMTVLKNGNVGIGIHNPSYKLDISGGNFLVRGDDGFTAPGHTGTVYLGSVHHYIKGEYGFGLKLGTYVAGDVISIREVSGNVGINTSTPDAKLDVNGTVKIGSSGVKFSEIYELTGTTGVPGTSEISVPYPTNYNMENTRVVSLEIKSNQNEWYSIGFYQSGDDYSIFCALTTTIVIVYPTDTGFNSQPFRLVLMKVE